MSMNAIDPKAHELPTGFPAPIPLPTRRQFDNEPSWERPDLSLLGTGTVPAPDFAETVSAALPGFWSSWCVERGLAASAPPDYAFASLVAAVSALLGNTRWPSAGVGWREPSVLWVAAVGSPGSGKSPAMGAPLELLRQCEAQLTEAFEAVRRDNETHRQVATETRAAWDLKVKEAVKAGTPPPIMPPEAMVPAVVGRPRFVIADATAEVTALRLMENPRGILMHRDELAGWLASFDRYSGASDRTFWLETYGGRPYPVDRKGKADEPMVIGHLSVAVAGSVQPDRLALITGGGDDGFSSRFLWVWPDQDVEFRIKREGDDDGRARAAFDRLAGLRMQLDDDGKPRPFLLPLTPIAVDRLEAFGKAMKHEGNNSTGALAGVLSKARGHALRLSCVLEHLEWSVSPHGTPPPERISERSVLAANDLVEWYFLPMARRVFGDASLSERDRGARQLARTLQRLREGSFNARVLRRSGKAGPLLKESADMNAACEALVDAELIRPAPSREGPTPGRTAANFEVNPRLLAD